MWGFLQFFQEICKSSVMKFMFSHETWTKVFFFSEIIWQKWWFFSANVYEIDLFCWLCRNWQYFLCLNIGLMTAFFLIFFGIECLNFSENLKQNHPCTFFSYVRANHWSGRYECQNNFTPFFLGNDIHLSTITFG